MRRHIESKLERLMKRFIRYFRWILLAAFIILICTGFFRVNSDEVALILRMGRLAGATPSEQILQPGLHYAFPYVIDEVVRVPVGKIKELTVTTHKPTGKIIVRNVAKTGYLMTGDSNIVMVEAAVKYRIVDPIAYVLGSSNPESMIDAVVSGNLLTYISKLDVDSVLTTGKAVLIDRVKKASQKQLNDIDCGVELTNIELTSVMPPEEVRSDFEAVNSAAVRKNTFLQEANEYRERIIPDAQAQAKKYIDTAMVRQQTLVAQAHSDIAVFDGLIAQFNVSKESVFDGYFRQRIAQIIQNMNLYIADAEEDMPVVILP